MTIFHLRRLSVQVIEILLHCFILYSLYERLCKLDISADIVYLSVYNIILPVKSSASSFVKVAQCLELISVLSRFLFILLLTSFESPSLIRGKSLLSVHFSPICLFIYFIFFVVSFDVCDT